MITVERLAQITGCSVDDLCEWHDLRHHADVDDDVAERIINEAVGDRIDAQVDAAVALLNVSLPPDWRERVTRPVQIMSWRWCVLGQLYGSYGRGCGALGIDNGPVSVQEAFCPAYVELAARLEQSWRRHLNPV